MIVSLFLGLRVVKEVFREEFLGNDKDELYDELIKL